VPETDPTRPYESPLTRSGRGPHPDTERVTEPGDPAIGGMDRGLRHWSSVARETEITRDEIERMADAFAMS
jgi:hypothetical protein